ncbi:hypothetical protein B0H10DRAFT_1956165 [Mycena sp. CBHHK59/15]|nr:hypothetical protein B0H10DRAFT_1956165 [Mycena sp. CBHHK59/15]
MKAFRIFGRDLGLRKAFIYHFSSIQIKADIRSDHKKLGIYKERWRTQLGKWIGDAQAADCGEADLDPEDEADDDLTPRLPNRLPAWKPMTLEVLFGGAEKPRARKLSTKVMEEEERLMEELADELEDQEPDEGAIEIDSDDEYRA